MKKTTLFLSAGIFAAAAIGFCTAAYAESSPVKVTGPEMTLGSGETARVVTEKQFATLDAALAEIAKTEDDVVIELSADQKLGSKSSLPKKAGSITIKSAASGTAVTLDASTAKAIAANCDLTLTDIKLTGGGAAKLTAKGSLTLGGKTTLEALGSLTGGKGASSTLSIGSDQIFDFDVSGFGKISVPEGKTLSLKGKKKTATSELDVAGTVNVFDVPVQVETLSGKGSIYYVTLQTSDGAAKAVHSFITVKKESTPALSLGYKTVTAAVPAAPTRDELKAANSVLGSLFPVNSKVMVVSKPSPAGAAAGLSLVRKAAGTFEYTLSVEKKKDIYVRAALYTLTGGPTGLMFATWDEVREAIEKENSSDTDYTVTLLDDTDVGGAVKMPKKGSYKSLTIVGAESANGTGGGSGSGESGGGSGGGESGGGSGGGESGGGSGGGESGGGSGGGESGGGSGGGESGGGSGGGSDTPSGWTTVTRYTSEVQGYNGGTDILGRDYLQKDRYFAIRKAPGATASTLTFYHKVTFGDFDNSYEGKSHIGETEKGYTREKSTELSVTTASGRSQMDSLQRAAYNYVNYGYAGQVKKIYAVKKYEEHNANSDDKWVGVDYNDGTYLSHSYVIVVIGKTRGIKSVVGVGTEKPASLDEEKNTDDYYEPGRVSDWDRMRYSPSCLNGKAGTIWCDKTDKDVYYFTTTGSFTPVTIYTIMVPNRSRNTADATIALSLSTDYQNAYMKDNLAYNYYDTGCNAISISRADWIQYEIFYPFPSSRPLLRSNKNTVATEFAFTGGITLTGDTTFKGVALRSYKTVKDSAAKTSKQVAQPFAISGKYALTLYDTVFWGGSYLKSLTAEDLWLNHYLYADKIAVTNLEIPSTVTASEKIDIVTQSLSIKGTVKGRVSCANVKIVSKASAKNTPATAAVPDAKYKITVGKYGGQFCYGGGTEDASLIMSGGKTLAAAKPNAKETVTLTVSEGGDKRSFFCASDKDAAQYIQNVAKIKDSNGAETDYTITLAGRAYIKLNLPKDGTFRTLTLDGRSDSSASLTMEKIKKLPYDINVTGNVTINGKPDAKSSGSIIGVKDRERTEEYTKLINELSTLKIDAAGTTRLEQIVNKEIPYLTEYFADTASVITYSGTDFSRFKCAETATGWYNKIFEPAYKFYTDNRSTLEAMKNGSDKPEAKAAYEAYTALKDLIYISSYKAVDLFSNAATTSTNAQGTAIYTWSAKSSS